MKRVLKVGAAALGLLMLAGTPAIGEVTKPEIRGTKGTRRSGKKRPGISGGTPKGGYRSRVGNRAREDGWPSRAAATEAVVHALDVWARALDRGYSGPIKVYAKDKRYLPGSVRRRMRYKGHMVKLFAS